MTNEITALRREYAELHRRVLDLYRQSDSPDISALQGRENEIVARLRELGASPYPDTRADHLRIARAC